MASDKDMALQTLLAYPYMWNPEKMIKFIHATWKVVDSKKDFKKDLDIAYRRLSKKNWNWITELGNPMWDILKWSWDEQTQQNVSRGKDTWVAELLRLIRNKNEHSRNLLDLVQRQYEHQGYYRDATKEIKSWFNNSGQLILKSFITFWNNKFPLLIPFLNPWVNLYKYRNRNRNSLRSFYWLWIDPLNKSIILNLHTYSNLLKKSLAIHLEEGALTQRYQFGVGTPLSALELRESSENELEKILDGSSIVFIEMNSLNTGCLSVTHYSSEGSCEILKFNGLPKTTNSLNLIFTKDIEDLEVWNYCNDSKCDIIVFGKEGSMNLSNEFVDGAFKQVNNAIVLCKFPISWKDTILSNSKQKQVVENGVVLIQGREVKIKNILSSYEGLSGDILNQLLRNQKPNLFGKYKLPKRDIVYLDRRVSVGGYVQLQVLLKCSPNDIFIVSNISNEMLRKLEGRGNLQTIQSLEDVIFTSNGKIFLLQEYVESLHAIIEKCMRTSFQGCIHYIHFNQDGNSRLIETIFAPLCKVKKPFTRSGPENQFIEETYSSAIEPLFFVAGPGSGKSQLFASLAEKLTSKRFVIILSMRDFVTKIKSRVGMMRKKFVSKDITEILCGFICSNESEKWIIENWLGEQNGSLERIELMLDGFDELPDTFKKFAVNILEFIRNTFSRIRLWVASREPPHDGKNDFLYFPCSFEPFDESNQIKFFREYSESITGTKLSHTQVNLVNKLAKTVLKLVKEKLGIDITTAPLHCRVLAEYFEKNLMLESENSIEFDILSINDLFEKLIEKKFRVFLEKNCKTLKFVTFLIKNFFQVHTYFALTTFWSDNDDENESDFSEPLVMESCETEDYLKMGIITCVDPLIFIHRTFAEYLIARFICQVLEKSAELSIGYSKESFHKLLIEVLTNTDPSLNVNCPTILNFLNELLKSRDCTNLAMKNSYVPEGDKMYITTRCLEITFRYNLENISWLVLNMWTNDENDQFYCEVLTQAVRNGITKDFFIKICELFKYDVEGMNINNTNHFKVFESALKGNYKIGKYLMETWFEPDQWVNIQYKQRNGNGYIMHIILENYPTFSREKGSDNINVKRQQRDIIELIKYVDEVDPHKSDLLEIQYVPAIERRDSTGRTPLLTLPIIDYYGDYIEIRKCLIEELSANVNAVTKNGMSALHIEDTIKRKEDLYDAAGYYNETVKLLLENKFTLLDSKLEDDGQTPLMSALNYFGSQLLEETLKLFFDNKVDFNAKDNKGSTILHECISTFPVEFIRKLICYGCKPIIQNDQGKCTLCLCIEHKRFDVAEMLLEDKNEYDKNTCDNDCKTKFETMIKENLSGE